MSWSGRRFAQDKLAVEIGKFVLETNFNPGAADKLKCTRASLPACIGKILAYTKKKKTGRGAWNAQTAADYPGWRARPGTAAGVCRGARGGEGQAGMKTLLALVSLGYLGIFVWVYKRTRRVQ